ncbi:hypothetical protein [Mucilaginibacter gotjawali]|uniref:Pheromone shutdown protein TraB n=2 Tax=Mucilaginibacter gotjawali TaxID=1550579 RepID=A0A839SMH7_9SPHI|nr:hypothetical protein [Mucilaginibacter gotjawali]MBB3059096.1 pheromone shutdown protein TraB [Mucilaginibacter gotjawali]BAU52832.1 hypothetical protein MgSA37_00996 [Mucilaginibacter gotjawali]
MKILLTNWINICGLFITTFFTCVIISLNSDSSPNFIQAILASLFSVCLYGMIFWGLFVVLIVFLDLILVVYNQNYLTLKLLIEWFLISSPFVYWFFKYNEWIFAVVVASFLITQLMRKRLIVKVIGA